MQTPVLPPELLTRMDAYSRAAKYCLNQIVQDKLIEYKLYIDQQEDMPEIRHWQWPGNVKNAESIKPRAEL